MRVTVLLDVPTFAMITTGPDSPRTVLRLTGTVEVRPANDPGATPVTFPLDAAVRLTVVHVPARRSMRWRSGMTAWRARPLRR